MPTGIARKRGLSAPKPKAPRVRGGSIQATPDLRGYSAYKSPKSLSVTAPSEAEDTSLAYFASTPLV